MSWNSPHVPQQQPVRFRMDRSQFTTYFAEFASDAPITLPENYTTFAKQWKCTGTRIICLIQYTNPMKWDCARMSLGAVQVGGSPKFTIRPVGVQAEELDSVVRVAMVNKLDLLYPACGVFGVLHGEEATRSMFPVAVPRLVREKRMREDEEISVQATQNSLQPTQDLGDMDDGELTVFEPFVVEKPDTEGPTVPTVTVISDLS